MKKYQSGSLSRREFIGAAVASTLAVSGANMVSARSATSQRPNIVFILADDLGWGDLSIYGQPNYETPHLDNLAKEGIRFTNAYSASPVCTPTRVGFFTGRYPRRLPVGVNEPLDNVKRIGDSVGLPPEHPTIASLLRANGYDTALIGKWHCGYLPKYSPIKSGFDTFFGNFSGAIDYSGAVRRGDWKYVKQGEDEFLFDLATDEGEQVDLKIEHPDKLKQLRTKFQQWDSQLEPYPS